MSNKIQCKQNTKIKFAIFEVMFCCLDCYWNKALRLRFQLQTKKNNVFSCFIQILYEYLVKLCDIFFIYQ